MEKSVGHQVTKEKLLSQLDIDIITARSPFLSHRRRFLRARMVRRVSGYPL